MIDATIVQLNLDEESSCINFCKVECYQCIDMIKFIGRVILILLFILILTFVLVSIVYFFQYLYNTIHNLTTPIVTSTT